MFIFSAVCNAQPVVEPMPWYWFNVGYGTPTLTNSAYNQGGVLAITAGGRLSYTNITLVGGLENTINSGDSLIPERFSLFFGPGFIVKDKLIFLSMHTGLSYPFYRNAPDYPQEPGLRTCLDFGIRVAQKFTLGVGISNDLAKDVAAFNIRFWVQINSD
jgi:hypothetical protein